MLLCAPCLQGRWPAEEGWQRGWHDRSAHEPYQRGVADLIISMKGTVRTRYERFVRMRSPAIIRPRHSPRAINELDAPRWPAQLCQGCTATSHTQSPPNRPSLTSFIAVSLRSACSESIPLHGTGCTQMNHEIFDRRTYPRHRAIAGILAARAARPRDQQVDACRENGVFEPPRHP